MATISIRHRVPNLWRAYTEFLDKYTWKAQAVNTCLLMGAGDMLAQVIVEKRRSWKTYDKLRTVRFLGVGLFMLGPSMHVWYTSLDKIVKLRKGTTPLAVAVKKMLMDQCLYLPPYIASFIFVMGKLRMESNQEIKSKMSEDFGPILKTSYQIWPAIQIANFYFIPLQHRIMVMNLIGLVWNTYISWKAETTGDCRQKVLTQEHESSQVSLEGVIFWNKYNHNLVGFVN